MKKTFMRADHELLQELKELKKDKDESYAKVVRRLLDKEKRLK